MYFPSVVGPSSRQRLSAWLGKELLAFTATRLFHCSQVLTRHRWTASDDATLIQAINGGQKQDDIAKLFPERTAVAVEHRIRSLRRSGTCSEIKQSRQRQPWTAEEDQILRDARQQGLSWQEISKRIPTKSIMQAVARFRYITHRLVASKTGVPFSPEEDAELKHCRDTLRLSWSAIAARLPGRHFATLPVRYRHITPESQRTRIPRPTQWPDNQVRELRRLLDAGKSNSEIAEALGRTEAATYCKVYHLKYEPEQRSYHGRLTRPWSVEEVTRLEELTAQGHSIKDIAQQLDRSITAVHGRLWRTKLPHRGE